MPRGSRPGERRGGRQKGVPNKRTAAMLAEMRATGEMPLEYMLRVMRDEGDPAKEAKAIAKAIVRQGLEDDELEYAIATAVVGFAESVRAHDERRDDMAKAAARFCHATLQATAPIEPPDEDDSLIGSRRRPVSGSVDEIVARFTAKKGKR